VIGLEVVVASSPASASTTSSSSSSGGGGLITTDVALLQTMPHTAVVRRHRAMPGTFGWLNLTAVNVGRGGVATAVKPSQDILDGHRGLVGALRGIGLGGVVLAHELREARRLLGMARRREQRLGCLLRGV